jgi:hypothetical protein
MLASVSSLLTIYLTNSTTFVTRKESGVLRHDFPVSGKEPAGMATKRKVMYYVGVQSPLLFPLAKRIYRPRLQVAVYQRSKPYYPVCGSHGHPLAFDLIGS